MSKYNKLGSHEDINAQNPLSPPQILGNNKNDSSNKNLTPNSALPLVKSKVFELYGINTEEPTDQKNDL